MRSPDIRVPSLKERALRGAFALALTAAGCVDRSALERELENQAILEARDAATGDRQNPGDGMVGIDATDGMIMTGDNGQNDVADTGMMGDGGREDRVMPIDMPTDMVAVVDVPVDAPVDTGMVDGGLPDVVGDRGGDTGGDSAVLPDTGPDASDVGGTDVRDAGMTPDVPGDSGSTTCRPTSLAIGLRIGSRNVVNLSTNRAPVSIGYTGDCGSMMGRNVPFRITGLGFPYNQEVAITTVDESARLMRGVLDFGASDFSSFPMERSGVTLEASIEGAITSTVFDRDVVRPVISSMTRLPSLQAGGGMYRVPFYGDSIGQIYVTMWRVRDNLELFRTGGDLRNCVMGSVVQSCPNDGLGEEQVCLYTLEGENACVSRRLTSNIASPGAMHLFPVPDEDYRRAISLTTNSDTVRVKLVYCDMARNCTSTSPIVSRTN